MIFIINARIHNSVTKIALTDTENDDINYQKMFMKTFK